MRTHRPPTRPLLLLLLLALALALVALVHASTVTRAAHAPPGATAAAAAATAAPPLTGQRSGAWRHDAATALRLGLDWSADAAEEEEEGDGADGGGDRLESRRGGAGGVVEVATAHLRESLQAAWLPVGWMLHRALGQSPPSDDSDEHHDPHSHPLDHTYEAALAVFHAATGRSRSNIDDTQTDDTPTPAAPTGSQSLQLYSADAPPAQYVRFSSLAGWYGTDPINQLTTNSYVSLLCVGCDRSASTAPSVQWQLLDGTAKAGVHFDPLDQSPLSFLPSALADASTISFSVRPNSYDPYASVEARRESLLARNFTARIFGARAGSDDAAGQGAPMPVQTAEAPDAFGDESATTVRVRSQALPSVYFLDANSSVTDMDSVAIFSVACSQCGMVSISLMISADVAGPAINDVWGVDPYAPRRPLTVTLPLGSATPALPVAQPDLSLAGWTERGLENVTVAWQEAESGLADRNHLQVAHFALHLAPWRAQQAPRLMQFSFVVQQIDRVEDGVPAPPGTSTAWLGPAPGEAESAALAVPIVVWNDTATGHHPSTLLEVRPTLYCSPHGRMGTANRTLQSCLTARDDPGAAQSAAEYAGFVDGPLVDAFAAQPDVVLDPSITANTTCEAVRAWINASDWFQTQVAPTAAFVAANSSEQDHLLFESCRNLTTNATVPAQNDPLVQYCTLFERCYARDYFCHSWTDVLGYCICPYDRTGDQCETGVSYQCNVRLIFPPMDRQHYEDDDGALRTYSCPQPTSYRARLPSTADNPGSNSHVPLLPATSLQRKRGFLPHLDGQPPCLEYPSAGAETNPGVTNPHERTNPAGGQLFLFALHCAFMSDQDPKGIRTAWPTAADDPVATYTHVRQGPSDAVLARLVAGGYAWDKNYSAVTPAWSYEVLRRTEAGEVLFASSVVAPAGSDAIRLQAHVQNMLVISDSSRDVVSEAASAEVLQSPPSDAMVAAAAASGDPTPLLNSTLGFTFNLTSLPADKYWRGGRLHMEVWLPSRFERADPPASSWIAVPRGLDPVSARVPARIVIEQRDYKLPPPHAIRKLSMTAVAMLVLLCLACVAAIYKYYEHRREEQFQRLVQRAKARSARAAAEAKEAQQLRQAARERQSHIQ